MTLTQTFQFGEIKKIGETLRSANRGTIQQIKLALCFFVYLTRCQGDYNHDTINRVDSPQNSIQNLQRSFRSWN